jgi:hypothetical protein
MAEKFCSECGYANRVNAQFCVKCGHAFRRMRVQARFCPKCGLKRKMGAKFCLQCGYEWRPLPPLPPEPPIRQPVPAGIVLPPVAEIPFLDEDEALQETQIDPMSAAPQSLPEPLERKGGQTGIILTDEELERLRQQPDRPLFIYTPKPTKRR